MRHLFIIVFILAPFALLAQTGDYVVKGTIGNLNAPAKIYLTNSLMGGVSDSTTLQNGAFEFKGTVTTPKIVQLVLKRTGTYAREQRPETINFYLEPSTIVVNSPDSLQTATIKGGRINDDNERLKIALIPYEQERKLLLAAYSSQATGKRMSAEEMAAFRTKYDANEAVKKEVYLSFIQTNPNSFISLVAVKQCAGSVPDYSEIGPLFDSLSDEVKHTDSGKKYAEYLARLKSASVGAMAPNFTQFAPEGKPVKLSDFRGKYLLIDFWASWCGPCRQENPYLVTAYDKYRSKGFEILGISLDEKKEAWIKAIKDDHLAWKHASDLKFKENEVSNLYVVNAIPQNFLVDPTGKIIAKNIRGEAVETTLSGIFK